MSALEIQMVPVDRINPHPQNPRQDVGDIAGLTRSIKAQGIRQSLLLIPQGDRFTAVIGHRRLAAAKAAGMADVPAMIDPDLDLAGQLEVMLVENLQRTDLTPLEEAAGYQQLLDLGVPAATIARQTGRPTKTVQDRLKLLKLPDDARAKLLAGQATLADAATLDKVAGGDEKLYSQLVQHIGTTNFDWQVRQTREKAKIRAKVQPILDLLESLGVTELDPAVGSSGRIAYLDDVATAADEIAKVALPAGAVYELSTWSPSVIVLGPAKTAREQELEAKAQRARADAQEAKYQAKREAEAARAAIAKASYELRDAFVRGFVARKRLTAAERTTILTHSARHALTTERNITYVAYEWLTGDRDWNKGAKHVLKVLAGTDWATTDPAALLLLFLHLNVSHDLTVPAAPDLYRCLEALGHPISDDERGAVFGAKATPAKTEDADE